MLKVVDLFSLPLFSEFSLVSGKKGLYNQITGTSILEYETFEDVDLTFEKGEFVVTTLSQAKGDPDYAEQQIRYLINYGVSAIAIKTVFFKDIPDSLKEYSNAKGIPILLFEKVYFDDIIFTIKTLLVSSNVTALQKDRIYRLYLGIADPDDNLRIADQINPFFYDNIYCVYFTGASTKKINTKKAFRNHPVSEISVDSAIYSLVEFNHGAMLIYSFESKSDNIKMISDFLPKICTTLDDFNIGISSLHDSKKTLSKACQESVYANISARISSKKVVLFSDLGAEQILIPHLNDEWSINYYNKYLRKILDHDPNNKLNVLGTLLEYIKASGNIQETSKNVFLHTNTVRYRIDIIKKLWNMEEDSAFFNEAYFFCKLHQLYNLSSNSNLL